MKSQLIHILLIEDNDDDAFLLQRVLKEIHSLRFNITRYRRLSEALAYYKKHSCDIIFSDLFLLDSQGLETVTQLQKVATQTPIIVLTGLDDPETGIKAVQQGMQEYIYKNKINDHLLEHTIRHAIERKQAILTLEYQNRLMTLELEQAKITQSALLPQTLPAISGLEIATKYVPMKQIGGDFYDFFNFDNGKLGILLFDAVGHGVSAALLSFMISGLFKNLVSETNSPALTFKKINQSLYYNLPKDRFASAIYCIYDATFQSLVYSIAGHPPGYIVRPDTRETFCLDERSIILGAFSEDVFECEDTICRLLPGDKLILYTDGLLEARNESGNLFGKLRLQELLSEGMNLSIQELLDLLYSSVMEYTHSATIEDDLTIIGLEVSKKGGFDLEVA